MKNEHLARGGVLRIEDGRGSLIHVRDGALWLTQEGDARDRYLAAGSSFRLDRDGLAIAQALRPSTVAMTPHHKGGKPCR